MEGIWPEYARETTSTTVFEKPLLSMRGAWPTINEAAVQYLRALMAPNASRVPSPQRGPPLLLCAASGLLQKKLEWSRDCFGEELQRRADDG
ncbi:hypothetical protein AC579_6212 [Pseudocercospora musae]|uniref:Uncharacterized protein n=1 Tax=Pseudocercospora musae TaxID=113226 RepID=A0A139IC17_9PEZI|nr:hypothetical protein AC579_6212 [Pseudocercospora musae]